MSDRALASLLGCGLTLMVVPLFAGGGWPCIVIGAIMFFGGIHYVMSRESKPPRPPLNKN